MNCQISYVASLIISVLRMEWKQIIFNHTLAVFWKKTSLAYFDMFSILEAASILFSKKALWDISS